ncbi:MAG: pyruvate formate lyase family protein [Sedimentisphaeraceae bacterium JB056]
MEQLMTNWTKIVKNGAEMVRKYKRSQKTVSDWFFVQEIKMNERIRLKASGVDLDSPMAHADILCAVAKQMPLSIPFGAVIAGSQDGAFSASYSLINPSFKVEDFAGYCDPTAIYADISPSDQSGLTEERIYKVRKYWELAPYVRQLKDVYNDYEDFTDEVVFFFEPVTGHHIPDMRKFLKHGIKNMMEKAQVSGNSYGKAMARAMEAALILAERYKQLAETKYSSINDEDEKERLSRMISVLETVPYNGAADLHQAVQTYALLWQIMVIEQSPNPYAISAGNIDRVLAPYYSPENTNRDLAVELVRHLLCFFQVGNRCWAISQNVLVGGKDTCNEDTTDEMTYIVLDAFFATNDPQPALSVKLHKKTPDQLYEQLGKFFFTPGHSTPSLFNDDMMFRLLSSQGIDINDLPDYSIAGCQEPLIMGKSSLNTTNTWLNIAKILELALNDGKSLLSGKQLVPCWKEFGYEGIKEAYADLEKLFNRILDYCLPKMAEAGNRCTKLLGEKNPVPFTSSLMDGMNTFRDMRDVEKQGTKYNGSGCLIHGLSVVSDSLYAVKEFLGNGNWEPEKLRNALNNDFAGYEDIHAFVNSLPKYGNDQQCVDEYAMRIAGSVNNAVSSLKNNLGNPFLADWSTPSTHLLYGYKVGATPDGRKAKEMLGYGIDPTVKRDNSGLAERILSAWKLPFDRMTGGYASHIGLSPKEAAGIEDMETKGRKLKDEVIEPLFGFECEKEVSPYYVYFNIDSPGHLRKVLAEPAKYAPNGIYIMRIHGTFVNFLDLSNDIQEDIIARIESGK